MVASLSYTLSLGRKFTIIECNDCIYSSCNLAFFGLICLFNQDTFKYSVNTLVHGWKRHSSRSGENGQRDDNGFFH